MRFAAVLLIAACGVAAAAPMKQVASPGGSVCEWSAVTEVDVSWSQELMSDGGWALASQFASDYPFNAETADDFLCCDGRPIVAVEWWGAYWNPGAPPYAADFVIRFYENDAGSRFPRPGALLYQQECGAYLEELLPDQAWWYRYYCELPAPFGQEQGQTYWLSIQALYPWYEGGQWGWGECVPGGYWGAEAVQIFDVMGMPDWEPISSQDPYERRECAFVLYKDVISAASPSSWSMLKGMFR